MTTKTANKGAMRKAAEARRTKAAQRTPLPPRAGVIPAAREAIEEASEVLATESKSSAKARTFIESVRASGWEASASLPGNTGETDHVTVTAKRGPEVIFIEWVGGVYQPTATYTIADRTIKLRNASACKQYAARSPEVAQGELEKVSANRMFRRRETPASEVEGRKRPLPFALDAAEPEIVQALVGKAVRWHNRYRETTETAMVHQDPRKIHFTEWEGERIVNFLCPITGYRSFRLSALLAVGRAARGQANAGVEPISLEEE